MARPVYAYPVAPAPAYRTARQLNLSQFAVVGALLLILAVVIVAVSAFAVSRFTAGSHSTCTSNCPPKFATPLPEAASYTSSAYRYQVNYSSRWTVRSEDDKGVTIATRLGLVQVTGSPAVPPSQALQSTLDGLPNARWQDVTLVGNLKGAHLGGVDGIGSVYSANLVTPGSPAQRVRVAIIAATQGGVTVVVFAVDPADPKNSPNGMPEGQEIDYLCTEFGWKAGG